MSVRRSIPLASSFVVVLSSPGVFGVAPRGVSWLQSLERRWGAGDGAIGAEASTGAEAGVDPDSIDDDFPLPPAAGVAPTPPMGWNSWNTFSSSVNAQLVEDVADAIVSSGMQAAGYQYVNIDDGWAIQVNDPKTGAPQATRDATGTVLTDPTNFPDGIAPVAAYVHGKGLKLGIYSDRGTATCGFRAGSQGFETQDSTAYAAWGVDYLKYDNCNATLDIQTQYQTMGTDLGVTGRPFVFSLCAWAFYEWGIGTGSMWRTTTDIVAQWTAPLTQTQGSVFGNLLSNRYFAAYAGPMQYMAKPPAGAPAGTPSTPAGVPYGWNDPDMLEVGGSGLSDIENQSHFSMWAVMAAPLIAGNDVRAMSFVTKSILTNTEVIAINQDALGLQAYPVVMSDDTFQSVWAKPLNQSGARAVVLLNGGETASDISFQLTDIGLSGGTASARDLVGHADLGTFQDTPCRRPCRCRLLHGDHLSRRASSQPAPTARPSSAICSGPTRPTGSAGRPPRPGATPSSPPKAGAAIAVRVSTYAKGSLGRCGPRR